MLGTREISILVVVDDSSMREMLKLILSKRTTLSVW